MMNREEHLKLVIRGVSKSFGSNRGVVRALEDISLSVCEGEFVCFVGPSGCGKTTLLNLIAGLDSPDCGEILLDGQPIDGPGRDRTVMFQQDALFPWLDVFGNVMFGLKLTPGLSRDERVEIANKHIKLVGLEQFAKAHIHELSGGMKQRVALARALAPNPRVLLMDEPFGALDAMTREQLYRDMQEICRKSNVTIIFVTHNVREAVCLGDRVILFSPHPGRIRESFEVDLPRPRDINREDLSGMTRVITASLKGREDDGSHE